MRRIVAVVLVAGFALSGCGFVNSGQRGSTKPDGFVLRGYVSVGSTATPSASAGATPGGAGATPGGPCTAPPAANDVQAGGAVRVADSEGRTLAAGTLEPGVEEGGRCNFAFQITAVPGGVDRYVIGIGTRATATFPAHDLRSDKPAVILVDV